RLGLLLRGRRDPPRAARRRHLHLAHRRRTDYAAGSRARAVVSPDDAKLDECRTAGAPAARLENAPLDRRARARALESGRGAGARRSRSGRAPDGLAERRRPLGGAGGLAAVGASGTRAPAASARLARRAAERRVGTLAVPHTAQRSGANRAR